jgi:hypothetical protein
VTDNIIAERPRTDCNILGGGMAYFKELLLELTEYNSRMPYVVSTTDVMFYVSANFNFGV